MVHTCQRISSLHPSPLQSQGLCARDDGKGSLAVAKRPWYGWQVHLNIPSHLGPRIPGFFSSELDHFRIYGLCKVDQHGPKCQTIRLPRRSKRSQDTDLSGCETNQQTPSTDDRQGFRPCSWALGSKPLLRAGVAWPGDFKILKFSYRRYNCRHGWWLVSDISPTLLWKHQSGHWNVGCHATQGWCVRCGTEIWRVCAMPSRWRQSLSRMRCVNPRQALFPSEFRSRLATAIAPKMVSISSFTHELFTGWRIGHVIIRHLQRMLGIWLTIPVLIPGLHPDAPAEDVNVRQPLKLITIDRYQSGEPINNCGLTPLHLVKIWGFSHVCPFLIFHASLRKLEDISCSRTSFVSI